MTSKAKFLAITAIFASNAILLPACASAQPLTDFPNLDAFTAVDADAYDVAEHTGSTTEFKTADKFACELNGYVGMECSIPFAVPGFPSNGEGCTSVGYTKIPMSDGDPHPYEFKHQDEPCPPADGRKLLPNNSKISYVAGGVTDFTCAAAENLVACIDNDKHGFVLQPSKSWVF